MVDSLGDEVYHPLVLIHLFHTLPVIDKSVILLYLFVGLL